MDFINFTITGWEGLSTELEGAIRAMYDLPVVSEETRSTINDLKKDLSKDLAFCIEYPYVDKVYRDSYYHYFASKHKGYDRDCIRVSLFDKSFSEVYLRDPGYQDPLQNSFRGYVVIRPTFPRIIGRTLIDKRALTKHDFKICQSKGLVCVKGMILYVEGFPFSSQDAETISCAETSVWAIMEYFGTRYPEYRPALPSSILRVLSNYSNQRMLPTNGLTAEQISFALKEFGFGTFIYSKETHPDLEDIIATYIESGIPVVATLVNDKIAHALLIVGHETEVHFEFKKKQRITIGKERIPFTDHANLVKKFVVQDDNLTPYKLISLNRPSSHYRYVDPSFKGCKIDAIVVPLYSKIYLEAVAARALVLKIASDPTYGFKFGKDFVFRFFLTSSRSWKSHIASLKGFNPALKYALSRTRMPKFIWCAELYKKGGFEDNRTLGLIVLDATEASEIDREALIFSCNPKKCLVKAGKNIAISSHKLNLYEKFKNNLK